MRRCGGRLISLVRQTEECFEEKKRGEEASLGELELLMAHLLSRVVLPVQLTLFICSQL